MYIEKKIESSRFFSILILYAPSLVTDQPEVPAQPADQPVQSERQEQHKEESVDQPADVPEILKEQQNEVPTQPADQSTDIPAEQMSNEDLQSPVNLMANVDKTFDLPRINLTIVNNENTNITKPTVGIRSILPLPKIEIKDKRNGKRPSQKSKVLTSSPFKNMLVEKEKEKKEREKAKAERMAERDLNRKTKENNKNNRPKQTKKKTMSNPKMTLENHIAQPSTSSAQITELPLDDDDIVTCPGCGESYSENWIQCGICKEWWHEDCSAYEGNGPFVCDHC